VYEELMYPTDKERRRSGGDFYADGFNDGVEALHKATEEFTQKAILLGFFDWREYEQVLQKVGFRVVSRHEDCITIEPIHQD
jgi:hypothetical protein